VIPNRNERRVALPIAGLTGAVGLGFLLAILAYNLLKQQRPDNMPIYVFEVFCFGLVLVGALLQYSAGSSASKIDGLQSKVTALQTDLNAAMSNLTAAQAELQATKNNLAAALQKSQSLESSLNGLQQAMARISAKVPDAIKNLESVNGILTGNYCEGGASGKPIWDGRGTAAAKLSTKVMHDLTEAKASIDTFLPPVPKK
jgi:outer membrane murein-binding lipoprotein Lpp